MQAFQWAMWLISGGWAKDYRTQLMGIGLAVSGVWNAFVAWAVGDVSLMDMLLQIQANWPSIVSGLAIWFVGDKLNKIANKPELVAKKPPVV